MNHVTKTQLLPAKFSISIHINWALQKTTKNSLSRAGFELASLRMFLKRFLFHRSILNAAAARVTVITFCD